MNNAIQEFIQGKRFAIVGVSRSGKKFGNTIYAELKARGYQVYIVHPEAQEIGGETCCPNLASLAGKIDGVIVTVRPEQATAVLREAAQAGITRVWLQQGAQSPAVLAVAAELGLTPVAGKCILMYLQPVRSVHRFHRVIAQVFGQL